MQFHNNVDVKVEHHLVEELLSLDEGFLLIPGAWNKSKNSGQKSPSGSNRSMLEGGRGGGRAGPGRPPLLSLLTCDL